MLQTMAVCVAVCVRNAGGFLEDTAGCTGPGLAFAERIMWKCMSQGIEALQPDMEEAKAGRDDRAGDARLPSKS